MKEATGKVKTGEKGVDIRENAHVVLPGGCLELEGRILTRVGVLDGEKKRGNVSEKGCLDARYRCGLPCERVLARSSVASIVLNDRLGS